MRINCMNVPPAAIALLLVGCGSGGAGIPSNGTVSVADARQYVSNLIERNSGGGLKLIAFEKTDGQASESGGVKAYRMDTMATVQHQRAFSWCADGYATTVDMSWFHELRPDGLHSLSPYALCTGSTVAGSEGDRASVSIALVFTRSEAGWNVENVLVSNVRSARQEARQ